MSHVTTIKTEIRDLGALKSAVCAMGLEWCQDQHTFTSFEGDSPCTHAIQVPGVRYGIGLRLNADGRSWGLHWDTYGNNSYDDGKKLLARLGKNMGLLVQAYGVHKTIREASRAGLAVRQCVQADGSIRLTLTERQ